jgi:hypothetical protein
MQKTTLSFLFCFISIIVFGQNISIRKNLSNSADFFDAITVIDSTLFIKSGSVQKLGCDESPFGLGHGSISISSLDGKTTQQIETAICDTTYDYCFGSNSNLLAINKNKTVAAYGDCKGSGEIRLLNYIFSLDSTHIHSIIPDSGFVYLPLDIEFLKDTLYLILKTKDYQYELWQLDENYDVTRKEVLYDRRLSKINASITSDSTLLLIMSYSTSFDGRNMIIREYDAQLNLLREFEYSNDITFHALPSIYHTMDNGYITSWGIDLEKRLDRWIVSDTLIFPPAITKFDAHFELEWEHIFIEKNADTELISFKKVADNKYLGCGYSSEYQYVDTLDNYLDNVPGGYVFLINDEGELLWRRYITDTRSNRFNGLFWDGCAIPGGYAFAGLIDTLKEEPDPFLNDPAGWLVTLDTNGCWNGNCNDYIIIINDDSSTTLPIDTTTSVFQPPLQEELSTIKAYPNPTSSVVTLEFDAPASRTVEFLNLKGEILRRIPTESPKLILQIGGYPPGMYLIRVLDKHGRLEGRTKIVVQ